MIESRDSHRGHATHHIVQNLPRHSGDCWRLFLIRLLRVSYSQYRELRKLHNILEQIAWMPCPHFWVSVEIFSPFPIIIFNIVFLDASASHNQLYLFIRTRFIESMIQWNVSHVDRESTLPARDSIPRSSNPSIINTSAQLRDRHVLSTEGSVIRCLMVFLWSWIVFLQTLLGWKAGMVVGWQCGAIYG